MGTEKLVLIDNNIVQDFHNADSYAVAEFKRMNLPGVRAIATITYMEHLCSTDGRKYLHKAKKFLQTFRILDTTPSCEEYARILAHSGAIKHKEHIRDCLLAAVALGYGLPLGMANVKDFQRLHKELLVLPYTQYSTYLRENKKPLGSGFEDA